MIHPEGSARIYAKNQGWRKEGHYHHDHTYVEHRFHMARVLGVYEVSCSNFSSISTKHGLPQKEKGCGTQKQIPLPD